MAPHRTRNAKASSSTTPYSPPTVHVKRPPNEWLCFRSEQLALKKAAHPDGKFCMDAISTELSIRWAEMDAAAKEPYKQAARDAKALHAALHPNYKYTPLSKKAKAELLAQQEAAEMEGSTAEAAEREARPKPPRRRRTRRKASAPPAPTPTAPAPAPTVAMRMPPPFSLGALALALPPAPAAPSAFAPPPTFAAPPAAHAFAPQLGQGAALYPPQMGWPQGAPIPHNGPVHWAYPPQPHAPPPMQFAMSVLGPQHLPYYPPAPQAQVAPAMPPPAPPCDIAPAPMYGSDYPGDLLGQFVDAGASQQGGGMADAQLAAYSSVFDFVPSGPPSDASSASSPGGWNFGESALDTFDYMESSA